MKNTNKDKIYQILSGNIDEEFYSFSIPTICAETAVCNEVIKKVIISEIVLGEVLEEYYEQSYSIEDKKTIDFDLSVGFVIKLMNSKELPWLGKDENMAKEALKNKVLQHYQNIVPKLVENVSFLKQELQNIKKQHQHKKNFLIEDE